MNERTRMSKSGVFDTAVVSTADKGNVVCEAVVDAIGRLVKEYKNRRRGERTGYHREKPNTP